MEKEIFIQLRKELHKNAELSERELKTGKLIQSFIQKHCPSAQIIRTELNGFIVYIKGFSKDSNAVALRCELDALPIKELNIFDHKSNNEGTSHKCGHDGHMTILCAVAYQLNKNRPKGDVFLLFQPAEEIGTGAEVVINSTSFNDLNIDYIFALHNIPGYPMHEIHCKSGQLTPSVISLQCKLKGRTSHAAEPEKGTNPAYALSAIIQEIENLNIKGNKNEVITIIHAELGSKDYGISAGEGEIGFTLRTKSKNEMDQLKQTLLSKIISICKLHHIELNHNWCYAFTSIVNHEEAFHLIKGAAEDNNLNFINKDKAFPWGEDFRLFTNSIKGAMFGLGAGTETPPLHNAHYDFPDELIETGKKMFLNILKNAQ